ncbi:MAG TPA: HypC/HybG/HupF family hydrogenase formation chaperone [Candidatus Limnocylindrales bacterium]|nr:HypC/HybG/HupF family hydrogenase formation chaperone [Candidatus Limnocylindrales bacterium]
MCITAPARVISVDRGDAIVEMDGRRRRASTLVTPDVVAGEWVLVGAGSILRRLRPREARELTRTINAAITATERADATARPQSRGGSR